MQPSERIFVALDLTDINLAIKLSSCLVGAVGGVKIGKEFFTANGLSGAKEIANLGMPIFLDLKFHDIPNTVAGAIRAVASINPFILNVHLLGGSSMVKLACKTFNENKTKNSLLIGVTVLTSLEDQDLNEVGISGSVEKQVIRLAKLAQHSGLDGVVCSAREIVSLRRTLGNQLKLIVPGIRPKWCEPNDQKRIMTPAEAISNGADYIVIGRPITSSVNPLDAALRITEEIECVKRQLY